MITIHFKNYIMTDVEFEKFCKKLKVDDIIKLNHIDLKYNRELIIIIIQIWPPNVRSYNIDCKCIMDNRIDESLSILGETMKFNAFDPERWNFEKL
jgi:hypothetical protein